MNLDVYAEKWGSDLTFIDNASLYYYCSDFGLFKFDNTSSTFPIATPLSDSPNSSTNTSPGQIFS